MISHVMSSCPVLTLVTCLTCLLAPVLNSDFAIKILGDLSDGDGYYRLDYRYTKVGHTGAGTRIFSDEYHDNLIMLKSFLVIFP